MRSDTPRRRLGELWPAPRPRPLPERAVPLTPSPRPGMVAPPPPAEPMGIQAPPTAPEPVLQHIDDPGLWSMEPTRSPSAPRSRLLQWLVAVTVATLVAGAIVLVGSIR